MNLIQVRLDNIEQHENFEINPTLINALQDEVFIDDKEFYKKVPIIY